MKTIQIVCITLVAIIHIYILILEMFLWTTKRGIKAFALKSKTFAEETKVMAANQGLYNGFLVLGLLWALVAARTDIAIYFLGCVAIAGIYGAYSTKQIKILYIQTIPATLGILSILFL